MAAPLTGKTAKKNIDEEQLQALAERQWSTEQMAAFFRCSRDTLEQRFSAIIKNGRAIGRGKLVDLAFKKALNGDSKMIIYLMERYCGQTGVALGDVTNIQVNNYAKLPEEKLTETIDLLSAGATEVE